MKAEHLLIFRKFNFLKKKKKIVCAKVLCATKYIHCAWETKWQQSKGWGLQYHAMPENSDSVYTQDHFLTERVEHEFLHLSCDRHDRSRALRPKASPEPQTGVSHCPGGRFDGLLEALDHQPVLHQSGYELLSSALSLVSAGSNWDLLALLLHVSYQRWVLNAPPFIGLSTGMLPGHCVSIPLRKQWRRTRAERSENTAKNASVRVHLLCPRPQTPHFYFPASTKE